MSAGSESDSSNGTKSQGSGMLDSVIRIRTLHALSFVVAGVLALSGFFWSEFKELERDVDKLKEQVVSPRAAQFGEIIVPEKKVPRNETHTQNSE